MDYTFDEPSTGNKKKKKVRTKKSDHKHDFYKVLIALHSTNGYTHTNYCLGEKCKVCGKLRLKSFFISEKTEDGCYRLLHDNEVLEKYKDLELVHSYEWP